MSINILIADDHTIIREGLRSLFDNQPDMSVVGEAADGISIRNKALMQKPDIILMDISMPGLNGMATTRLIKEELPQVHIIGLSVYCERQFILGMLQAGAEGYLVKSDAFRHVLEAIHHVLAGHIFMSQHAREIVFKDFKKLYSRDKKLKDALSAKDHELIEQMIKGKKIDDIAENYGKHTDDIHKINTEFIQKWLQYS